MESIRQQEPERIQFAIRGPAVDGDFRFHQFTDIVSEYNSALEHVYLALVNKDRMSAKERDQFEILVTNWDRGSVLMDLAVVAAPLAQGYLDLSQSGGYLSISQFLELGYEFIKTRIEHFMSTGKEPTISIVDSPGAVVNYNAGDGTLEVSRDVLNVAVKTESNIAELASHIDGNELEEIGSLSQDGRGITLTMDDRQLFEPKVETLDPEEIAAKVYRFDVVKGEGRIAILRASDLNRDDNYRFKLIGDLDPDPFVDALHTEIEYSDLMVLREIERHPTGIVQVKCFHVQNLLSSVNSS